jgi:hypothetical protein
MQLGAKEWWMDEIAQTNWDNLRSHDGTLRLEALNSLLTATDQRVD